MVILREGNIQRIVSDAKCKEGSGPLNKTGLISQTEMAVTITYEVLSSIWV